MNTDARITDVVVTPIAFPDPPLLNVLGVHQPWALRTIVELRCGDALVGLGETYGDDAHLERVRDVAGTLTGLDPFDLVDLGRRTSSVVGRPDAAEWHGLTGPSSPTKIWQRVFSAFEVACLDLQGQLIDRPVHALLGGKVRDEVPFSAYLFYKWAAHPDAEPDEWGEALDPAGIVAQAERMISQYGFTSIKLKGGVFSPEDEIAAIRALREAFPDHPLRLDPNTAWTVDTSMRVATETEGLLEYLEDPTPTIDGMAQVAGKAPMPLATNMCVVEFAHLPDALAKNAVGVVLADHHYWGGLTAAMQLARICQTWDIGLSMHSNSHLGISLAAMTHLAAAAPNLTYAVDTHTPWQCGADVVDEPLAFRGGSVTVPNAPGLGVTLDRDALARMHEDYQTCGIRRREDTTYMRTVQPDFDASVPRW
jgi:glucarate dehydratase